MIYDHLNGFIAKCVPKRRVDTLNCPFWFTPELKCLKNRRNQIFNKNKLTNSNFYCIEYIKLKYSFIQHNSACYKNYLVKVKNNIKINPKNFYDFVNSKRKSAVYRSTMSYSGTASSDDKAISNLFATFFKTTYSTEIFNEFKKYPYSLQSFDFAIPVIDEW